MKLEKLIGQDQFLKAVLPYINMYKVKMSPKGRPAGIFYLVGPTGVGKTHAVRCLADEIQNSKLIVINCAEFQQDHEVAKLIGAPPGYVGHRETSPIFSPRKIIEAHRVKEYPFIVLFDEIEKASRSLFKILLGIMDSASLHLGDGGDVHFDDALIFFTSNVGSDIVIEANERAMGFSDRAKRELKNYEKTKELFVKRMEKTFSPEFMNRLDEIIFFNQLSENDFYGIVRKELNNVVDLVHLSSKINRGTTTPPIVLEFTDGVVDYIKAKSISPKYGARETKRVVFREIQSHIATIIAEDAKNEIKKIKLDIKDGKLMTEVVVFDVSDWTDSNPEMKQEEDPAVSFNKSVVKTIEKEEKHKDPAVKFKPTSTQFFRQYVQQKPQKQPKAPNKPNKS